MIVVAQYGIDADSGFEPLERLDARTDVASTAVGEIPSERYQIGVQSIDGLDAFLDVLDSGKSAVMNIAQVGDCQPPEFPGKIGDLHLDVRDRELLSRHHAIGERSEPNRRCRSRSEFDQSSPR